MIGWEKHFFGTGISSASSIKCLRRWDNVCKCKDQGGLGVKNIRYQNIALLGKWLWKALNDKDVGWVKLLKARLLEGKLRGYIGNLLLVLLSFGEECGDVVLALYVE